MKKNLFTSFLDFFAPNYCYFCQKIGDLICDDCLESQDFKTQTIYRKSPNRPSREFFLGDFEGKIAEILDDLKFQNKKENALLLAKILASALEKNSDFADLKKDMILVPAPTSEKHIRQRGFAHSELISKNLAEFLKIQNQEIIIREKNLVQKGASAKLRKSQAEKSYFLKGEVDRNAIYVIFDDIRTTGSTIDAISKLLFEAGAREVWAIYVVRQKI